MSVSREAVAAGLLVKLSATAEFKSTGRRNRRPDSFAPAETPVLMLVEHSDVYRNQSTRQPSVRRMMLRAMLYFDVGDDENAIPSTFINEALDALDALLVADDPMTGACTLSGLVASIVIDGTVIRSPGDVTGKSLAVVPLNVLLP